METTSEIGKGSTGFRQTPRAKGLGKNKTKKRTARTHHLAFLGQRFYPLLAFEHAELSKDEEITSGFYTSVDNLCLCYNLEVERFEDFPYPLNIGRCMDGLVRKLASVDSSLELRLVQDEVSKARLTTVHTFSNGNTLFYLPIEVVFYLLDTDRTTAELLLSVYSYLFRFVGIPHYAESYSYLGGIYEMIGEWHSEEDDPDRDVAYYDYILGHLGMIEEQGKISILLLNEKIHVADFAKRVEGYHPSTKAQTEFLETARGFLDLLGDFPKRNIHDRISPPLDEDAYDDGVIRLEQYLHFFWDYNEPIHQEFMDSINAELNECSIMEEPTTFQYFDTPQLGTSHEHDFEKRLCELLHSLTDNVIDLRK